MTPCPACGGRCRPLERPQRPRGRLILALATALLLWATVVSATPLHFGSHQDRPTFFLCAGDPARWTGPLPVTYCPFELNRLGVVAWMTPFPQPSESLLFHTDAVRYGTEVLFSADVLVPQASLATFDFLTLGLAFTFLVPDDTYLVQPITLHFTLPDDARTLEFDYLQPVPEPATIFLLGSAMVALGITMRRRGR